MKELDLKQRVIIKIYISFHFYVPSSHLHVLYWVLIDHPWRTLHLPGQMAPSIISLPPIAH